MNELPMYVKVDDYKEVSAAIDAIKAKLEEAKQTLSRLKELKDQEDAELASWESTIADAGAKIDDIDQSLQG
ncbi:MAG TPA: hypothetical protein VJI46_01590 [Candidatus Nanoarchaeia archaeon]|nr:hypothetical protein [Candidatus Nanoarchaeia archaeon]